ncbi:MAG: hypothetical protein V9H26_27755 [Verrucomicrobiota bacterium]|nr:hypothetical protein [Verrucomicrobiota bacterium]MCC6823571.1 hypothetical protein [Limisphaerales bacterium]
MRQPTRPCLALLLVGSVILNGCGRDNGLPAELTEHLVQRGIQLASARIHVIITKAGLMYLVAEYAYG